MNESADDSVKIQEYKRIVNEFSQLYECLMKDEGWAGEMLACTKKLLLINPEYYTAWNERKRAIQLLTIDVAEELAFNVATIKANPKSYVTWQHRRWLLQRFDCKDAVSGELALLEKLLILDCRNFHGWNYRIWLADWAQLSVVDEFDYTTRKIYENFSNYSAWQRRAHLFVAYAQEMGEVESLLKNEVEMCRTAAWTEPADQSVWFYQNWLFSKLSKSIPEHHDFISRLLTEQVSSIRELIKEEPRASLAHAFLLKFDNEYSDTSHLQEIDPLRCTYWQSFK